MDRFLQRALAERVVRQSDSTGHGDVGCSRVAGLAAAGQCGRSNRNGDTHGAEWRRSPSRPVYRQSYVEILGVAGHKYGGSGIL